jgi:hypothetical protein
MAIKNTTSKKTVTKVVVKEPEVEIIKQPEKKIYMPNDEIMTTSCTAGELIMIGRKTNRYYSWANYGDTTPVEYQDLKAEQYISGSQYIYNPLFIIEDEEFLALPENKKIAEVYDHVLKAEDIDKIFNLDNISFEKTIDKLPKGIRNSLKAIAAERIQNGSLDRITKVKALDKILGTDLFNCYFTS